MSVLQMPAIKKLLPLLESSLNKTLSMDPAAASKLRPLNGCILELNITSWDQSFFFKVEQEKIVLLNADAAPTVTLSGSSMALLKLALTEDKNGLFKRKEVSLGGDAVRAQQIQTLVRNVAIDWEALLAEAIGDVPAHLVISGLHSGWSWTRSISQSLRQDLEEFLKYELQLLPNKAMARRQFEAIDQLRLATDRLEARFKKLISPKTKHVEKCQN